MRIYTVLSLTYSGCDRDAYVETYKSFNSQEAANRYLLKISKKSYDEYFDEEDYDYTYGGEWAQISNEEHIDNYSDDDLWYKYYKVKCTDLCKDDTIILNS